MRLLGGPVWLLAGAVLAAALTACAGGEPSTDQPAAAVTTSRVPTAVDRRPDADPHDGVAGEVVLSRDEIAYRDRFGLTDVEAHDAFGYSCAILGLPERFDRFANQPDEETEP